MPVATLARASTEDRRATTSTPPGPDQRRVRLATAVVVVLLIGISAGPLAAAAFAAVLTGALALRTAARRWPQAVGSGLVSLTTLFMVLVLTGVFGPWLSASGSPDLGVALLLVTLTLAAAVWAAPLTGVHRGWTTLLVLIPLWIAAPVIVAMPEHSAVVALSAGGLGGALMIWQARYRVRGTRSRGARRGLKIFMVALTGTLGLMSGASAAPGVAQAWSLSGAFNSFKESFVCSISAPNTSPELAGTGPEGLIGNYNFAQLEAVDQTDGDLENGRPVAMDRELAFDRNNLDQYTLYELSGLRGIKFINWSHTASGDGDCSIMAWVSVTSGNMINMASKWLLQLAIFLKEYSNIKNPVASFFDPVTPITDALLSVMFAFMGALIVGMLIWGFFASRRSGLSVVLNKYGSALGAIVIAGTMYGGMTVVGSQEDGGNGFFTMTNTLDSVSGAVSSGVSELILGRLPDGDTSMCERPSGDGGVATAQRFSSCLLAEALAYKPWAKATFGTDGVRPVEAFREPMNRDELLQAAGDDDDADEDAGPRLLNSPLPCYNNYQGCGDLRSYLIAQAGGPTILRDMELCFERAGFDGDGEPDAGQSRACNPYFAVAEDLFGRVQSGSSSSDDDGSSETSSNADASNEATDADKGARMLSAYRGDGTFAHAQNAFTSLIGVLIVGSALGILAGAVIWKHVELLILFILGPGYLLAGALKSNLQGSLDWLKKIAGTFVSLTAYSIIGSAAVFFVALISMQDTGLIQQLIMMALVMFGFFKAFSTANQKVDAATGTRDAPGMETGINKAKRMVGAGAVGAMASRAVGGGRNGQPGIVRRTAGGTARVGSQATKGTARGIGRGVAATGRGVANNTRGLQFKAGQVAGAASGTATYGAARVKAAVTESGVAEKARNLRERAATSAPVKTASTAGAAASKSFGGVKSFIKGDDQMVDPGKTATSQGKDSGRRVVAGVVNGHEGESVVTRAKRTQRQERRRLDTNASRRARAQERQAQEREHATRQAQDQNRRGGKPSPENPGRKVRPQQRSSDKKRTNQNITQQAEKRAKENRQRRRQNRQSNERGEEKKHRRDS